MAGRKEAEKGNECEEKGGVGSKNLELLTEPDGTERGSAARSFILNRNSDMA